MEDPSNQLLAGHSAAIYPGAIYPGLRAPERLTGNVEVDTLDHG